MWTTANRAQAGQPSQEARPTQNESTQNESTQNGSIENVQGYRQSSSNKVYDIARLLDINKTTKTLTRGDLRFGDGLPAGKSCISPSLSDRRTSLVILAFPNSFQQLNVDYTFILVHFDGSHSAVTDDALLLSHLVAFGNRAALTFVVCSHHCALPPQESQDSTVSSMRVSLMFTKL
jgi:hypothetical protein